MIKWFVEDAPIRSKMMIVVGTTVAITTAAGLLGLYEVFQITAALKAANVPGASEITSSAKLTMTIGMLSATVICLGLGLWFRVAISNPFVETVVRMEGFASGDTATPITRTAQKDCVGRMARTLQVFRQNALDKMAAEGESVKAAEQAKITKTETMKNLADGFESSISHVVETLASAAIELEATSETLSQTAQDTSRHSDAVARTADMSANNVQTVASASEEMSASISGIAQQVGQAASIAQKAELKATETNATVLALSAAAGKIGAVVSLISDIASQTNLLALNATIEADRKSVV